MEIAVYFLAVLLTVLLCAIVFLVHKIKNERSRNRSLSALINASHIYMLTWTTDFLSIETNKTLSEFLDSIEKKADEGFLRTLFLDNDSLGTTGSVLLMAAMSGGGRKTEFTLPDGTVKHILWKSKIVSSADNFSVIATIGTDVTEEYSVKEKLDAAKIQNENVRDNLDAVAESAEVGVFTLSNTAVGYELDISEKSISMLGLKSSEAAITAIYDKLNAEDKNLFVESLHSLSTGSANSANVEADVKISEDNIHRFVFKMKATGNRSKNTQRITVTFIDVTHERENLRSVNAGEDSLTGFLNRNGFFTSGASYLEKMKQENRGVVMINIKIERFQKISTLFGIEIADRLISTYAQGIEKCSPKPALFGKIALEDFAVAFPCSSIDETEFFAKNLTLFIENACNGKILPSILIEQSRFTAGVCFFDNMDDIVTLYNKANMMLFADGKRGQHICHYFDKAIEERLYNRDLIESELLDALKNGEFELYYQPKMSFDGSEICGMEALMRWNHPSNGIVPPMSFIPIAEESGLITRIDEWGLTEACRQAKAWQNKGYKPLRVSVNMSQMQLYHTDVVASIKNALAESGLDARYLEVELTETTAMQDIDRSISILKRIQALGVSVSMDDFGTGYSSLSALKLLPIDILKIDRSLISDIGGNATSYSIVKAIVELGNALELEVLAEGVETEEQSRILNELGCNIVQGFLYGKPISAVDIEREYLEPLRIKEQQDEKA